MRRRTFSSPYYVKGRSHQAEHGGAWRQLEATGVSSSWWLSGNPGSGATLSKDCGRAKRVRNVSRLGAQSGCELRFYAYAIGRSPPRPSYLLFFSITFLVRTSQNFKRFEQRGPQSAVLPSRVLDHPSEQTSLLFCRLLHEHLARLAGEA